MPGIVKIGCSKHLAEDRARQLRSTGVPLPFKVEHRVLTSNQFNVEKAVHDPLSEKRIAVDREYFSITPHIAISAVQRARLDTDGIRAWSHSGVTKIRAGDRISATLRSGQIFLVLQYDPLRTTGPNILDVWQAHSDGDLLELMATASPRKTTGLSTNDPQCDIDPVPFLGRDDKQANGAIIGKERIIGGQRLIWIDRDSEEGTENLRAVFEPRDYCQITCRSWAPQLAPNHSPLLLNVMTSEPTPKMTAAAQSALELVPPRTHTEDWQECEYGTESPAANYWLRQLSKPERKRYK